MFRWKKMGLVFSPRQRYNWMYSHAQIPFPVEFPEFIRVYFATREKYNGDNVRAYGGFVDLDKNNIKKIINISTEPILSLGQLGDFDEHGVMPCSIVKNGQDYLLYYVGWSRRVSVKYDWEIGIAKSKDGVKFTRIGRGPLLGPSMDEPYLNSTPIVYKKSDKEWHMFYHTGLNWIKKDNILESHYVLKHAFSTDGINWIREKEPIIPAKVKYECQTSPSIFYYNGKYNMFFCYREGLDFRNNVNKSYRIGYAFSNNLVDWTRDDSMVGITISKSGWDSEMIEYPHLFEISGRYYLFYCGNHFGYDGFGVAELCI